MVDEEAAPFICTVCRKGRSIDFGLPGRLGRWLRVEVEFEEGAGKPKTYTLRLTGPDGATATRDGLPFFQPEFDACAWCGFVGIDAKPAVFYVDDIRLE